MNHSIEILFLDGCPRLPAAVERVNEALAALGLAGGVDVRMREVENEEEAVRLAFLGSPTVRINGRDVEPSTSQRTDFGLRSRLYQVDGRPDGAPSIEWIKQAILSADR